ncbi:hypothetical protein Hanom_Chr00s014892g01753851 [Helianthus anomalus]
MMSSLQCVESLSSELNSLLSLTKIFSIQSLSIYQNRNLTLKLSNSLDQIS